MKIVNSNQEIQRKIEKILLSQIYEKMITVGRAIQAEIRTKNIEIWKSTDTYHSLLNGQLTHELGFPKGEAESMVEDLLTYVSNSLFVIPKFPNSKKGGFYKIMTIQVLAKNLNYNSFLIDTGFDRFGNEGVISKKRRFLPWAKWLLTEGNNYIIFNYEYMDIVADNSRSGKGLMIYDENNAWKVPFKYAGTRESNWLTRSLSQDTKLQSIYAEIISRHLNS